MKNWMKDELMTRNGQLLSFSIVIKVICYKKKKKLADAIPIYFYVLTNVKEFINRTDTIFSLSL